MMKTSILIPFISFCFLSLQLKGQNNGNIDSTLKMDTVYLKASIVQIKKNSLYEEGDILNPNIKIGTFNALNIYNGSWDKQCWKTENEQCLKLYIDPKNKELKLKWNKIAGGCKWIGVGFGWDQWRVKSMGDILDSAAIVMHIKTEGKKISNVPMAVALEDYAGTQCYLGFQLSFLNISENNSAKIVFPLNKFPVESSQIDINSIKQFIMQLEAEGSLNIEFINIERI